MSKYIKIPVSRDAIQANVIIFHKALSIIGNGTEAKGKKEIAKRVHCSGTEIKKIVKMINKMTNPSSSNTRFVRQHEGDLGIDHYYYCVKISYEKAECILRTMIDILIEKDANTLTDCFRRFYEENECYEATYLNALMAHTLDEWKDHQADELFVDYNKHLIEPQIMALSTYNSIIALHQKG